MSKKPPLKNEKCRGFDLTNDTSKFTLQFVLNAYKNFPEKDKFFNPFFSNLAGNKILKQQIIDGLSEQEIKSTWTEELNNFKNIRKKYLLYNE
jgi:uncharacterized protein YbbC (DUF1343 family)